MQLLSCLSCSSAGSQGACINSHGLPWLEWPRPAGRCDPGHPVTRRARTILPWLVTGMASGTGLEGCQLGSLQSTSTR